MFALANGIQVYNKLLFIKVDRIKVDHIDFIWAVGTDSVRLAIFL